jgi:hypothetical protein
MATRSIPPGYYAINTTNQVNLLIVNFNPHGTICPICSFFLGRIYSYSQQFSMPPVLPQHEHCYCWYEPTTAGIVKPPPPPRPPIIVEPPPLPPPDTGDNDFKQPIEIDPYPIPYPAPYPGPPPTIINPPLTQIPK